MLFAICALLTASVTLTTGNLVYCTGTSLDSTTIPLASNVYQNITGGSFSWTFWLQLSSRNQNGSTDVVIVSVASGSTVLYSLYLYQGKRLAVRLTTSSTTVALIYLREPPPFDQWFYAGFSVDSSTNEVRLGWRVLGGWLLGSTFYSYGAQLLDSSNAVLTLQYSKALGYLASANVSGKLIDVLNDVSIRTLPFPDCMRYSGSLLTGGTIFETSSPLLLSCPNNSVLVAITFAAFGHPTGLFPNFASNPLCDASVLAYVQAQCIGKSLCSVSASIQNFGDPCPGALKWLSITGRCSLPSTQLTSTGPTSSPTLSSSGSLFVMLPAPTSNDPTSSLSLPSTSSNSWMPQPPTVAASGTQSPPVILDRFGLNGMQNGFRVKIPLMLNGTGRSSTRNHIEAHLAVRNLCSTLQVDVSLFVMVDIISNQTSSILTFTILAGVTEATLAEGLRIAQSFQSQIQDPQTPLRQDPLLNTSSIPVVVSIECIPVQLCPSGDYVCLSESTCSTMAPSPVEEESTGVRATAVFTTAVMFGIVLAIAIGVCWRWNYRPKPIPTSMVKFPVSNTSFSQYKSSNLYRPPALAKESSGTSADASGFRLPESGMLKNRQSATAKGSASGFDKAGQSGRQSNPVDLLGTMFTQSPPLGVADTMSDLDKTFASLDNNHPF